MEFLNDLFGNLYLQTWAGAVIGHVLLLYKQGFERTIPFFKQMIPSKSETFYFRLDFFVIPILGSFLAFVFLNPEETKECIFTGLTWSGTLLAMLKAEESRLENSPINTLADA